MLNLKVEIEIKGEQLLNVMESANIHDWGYYSCKTSSASIKRMLLGGKPITVFELGEGDGNSDVAHFLDKEKVKRVIQIMAAKYPHKLAELMDEDRSDMYTGDFLIQLSLFNEEKYA